MSPIEMPGFSLLILARWSEQKMKNADLDPTQTLRVRIKTSTIKWMSQITKGMVNIRWALGGVGVLLSFSCLCAFGGHVVFHFTVIADFVIFGHVLKLQFLLGRHTLSWKAKVERHRVYNSHFKAPVCHLLKCRWPLNLSTRPHPLQSCPAPGKTKLDCNTNACSTHLPSFWAFLGEFCEVHTSAWVLLLMFFPARLNEKGVRGRFPPGLTWVLNHGCNILY